MRYLRTSTRRQRCNRVRLFLSLFRAHELKRFTWTLWPTFATESSTTRFSEPRPVNAILTSDYKKSHGEDRFSEIFWVGAKGSRT